MTSLGGETRTTGGGTFTLMLSWAVTTAGNPSPAAMVRARTRFLYMAVLLLQQRSKADATRHGLRIPGTYIESPRSGAVFRKPARVRVTLLVTGAGSFRRRAGHPVPLHRAPRPPCRAARGRDGRPTRRPRAAAPEAAAWSAPRLPRRRRRTSPPPRPATWRRSRTRSAAPPPR